MANQEMLRILSFEAAGDLSSHQFKFVAVDSSGQVALAGDGARAEGVLQNNDADAQGKVAEVAVGDRVKVIAGAMLTPGDKIQSNASGLAAVAASSDHVLGVCVVGGASGEVVEMLFSPQGILA